MTKQELEQLISLKQEAKQLQNELENLPFVPASVKGSMSEFPYIERTYKILGIDEHKGKQLREKLDCVLDEIRDKILIMEEWLETVEHAEIRTILRMYYRDGLTQAKIAEEFGYSEKTIHRKMKTFFKDVL